MSFDLPALPEGWSYAPLENCSQKNSITYGVVQPGAALDAGKPLIRVNNFKDGRLDLSDVMYIAPDIESKYSRTRLVGGEVLLTVVGSVGQVATVPSNLAGFNVARAVAVIHPLPHIEPRWIAICLRSPLSQHLLGSRANTTVQTTINLKDLRALPIPLPPVDERRTIGEFISALDDRITLLRETNATLEAIAQALFKSWFVDFDPVRAKMEGRTPEGMDEATAALFPDGFETSELGEVPRGWRVMPFLDACDMQGGAQPPASQFVDTLIDGYVRLLQIRDFSSDAHKTYVPIEKKLKLATEDDVLIGRYGSASGDKAKDSLGRVCRGLAGAYNVALMKLAPIEIGREFALQLVDDPRFYQYLQGVSSKAVQSGFSKKELGQYKVVVPPGPLAKLYEQFGEAVWQRSKELRSQAQTLSTLRDTLLPRLISGQLRLPEAQAAVEGTL